MREVRATAASIAVVPTMGNLHDGHLALMHIARGAAACSVATIFVNRLQFAPHEDFDRYPRTFEADCQKLAAAGVDYVFAPSEAVLYPAPQRFAVDPDPALADILEGAHRPGFFRGVATVVLKLFAIIEPDVAVFGKKDYQQWLVIRSMVEQLALRVRVSAGETSRASDGLALSSRNGYLTSSERAEAPRLHRTLRWIADALADGPREIAALEAEAVAALTRAGWQVDYCTVRRRGDLLSPSDADRELVVLAAARLGQTRLIDNLECQRS